MADVTGSIGNEYVELNNAATEVTLKQLLAAVQKQGGSTGAVGSTAGAAGVNAAAQVGASKDADRLGKGLLSAMSFMSGADAQTAQALQRADNVNKQQGIKTQQDAENQMKTIAAEQKKRN